MYVCVCFAVTETQVREAIESGATTRDLVTKHCRAGGDCGACHGMIEQMIEDHVEACEEAACPPPSQSGERLVPAAQLARTGSRRSRAA